MTKQELQTENEVLRNTIDGLERVIAGQTDIIVTNTMLVEKLRSQHTALKEENEELLLRCNLHKERNAGWVKPFDNEKAKKEQYAEV